MASSPKRWWNVSTEYDNDRGGEHSIGIYYGSMPEIAFHLAKYARGFYQDIGTLIFDPCDAPKQDGYKANRDKVNIIVRNKSGDVLSRKRLALMVRGEQCHLEESNYYDCTLLVLDKKSKK